MGLEGKIAVVTGASRGIGAAAARALAARGATIAIGYRENRDQAERLASEIAAAGAMAKSYRVDLENNETIALMIESVVRDYGRIDILINNAGIFGTRPFGSIDFDFFSRQFNTNVWGTIAMTQCAVLHFPETGGRIVNLSSQRYFQPKDGTGVYAASKAAISVLTQAFAIELGPRGITVNAVAPATTNTDMTSKVPEQKKASIAEATPLRRLAEPTDIADIIAFLASEEARWITGRTILADGGLT